MLNFILQHGRNLVPKLINYSRLQVFSTAFNTWLTPNTGLHDGDRRLKYVWQLAVHHWPMCNYKTAILSSSVCFGLHTVPQKHSSRLVDTSQRSRFFNSRKFVPGGIIFATPPKTWCFSHLCCTSHGNSTTGVRTSHLYNDLLLKLVVPAMPIKFCLNLAF